MDYPVIYDEKEMRAYKAARLYDQKYLIEMAQESNSTEVKAFVNKFLRVHGDINVEVN